AGLEPDVLTAGLEEHDGANREGDRHAREQTLDAVVVPNPAALEIGELELAAVGAHKQLLQGRLRAVETGADHDANPSPPVTSARRPRISCSSVLISASMTSSGLGGS